ncbi:unnamed protein product (macronuclear) [Paramecium tetraurelia]|uniref:Uncharacterized protein n=1 Tax=Paramecium tetraurelia TaxID=5888 RepID=A0BNK5_PARTE|nr:uncharacterized protein GSPATT00030760001 [Paramecium tetraurelia]CAK60122.1 unnamed protein product [Paramecium tetraurelia]|eukprot:XP_001427520.1 hypothetical protein (macronuclear) [Paramecium tetraurelia strain d4-2]
MSKSGLKLLQTMRKHKSLVYTLNFMKDRQQLVSSSLDNSIVIWSEINLSNPKYLTKLNDHKDSVRCLNYSSHFQSLIISGSDDHNIKFWYYQNSYSSWSCQQTIREHNDSVYGLSMNQEGTTLISCSSDKQILVMNRDNSNMKYWKVIQTIHVKKWGLRICYINNNMFAFLPHSNGEQWKGGKTLHIYTLTKDTKKFRKREEYKIQGGGQFCDAEFPALFVQSKQILFLKNGCTINLLKFNVFNNSIQEDTYQCKLQQFIYFDCKDKDECGALFGTISENGEYLITWDWKKGQIQVRRYQEILDINQI